MQPFGHIEKERILQQDDLFIVARDKFPVSPGHTLIIVKRCVSRFWELTQEEKIGLLWWVDWCIFSLQENLRPAPDGFNVGLNDGPAAGQTIGQLHAHVIPRYSGDVSDPRGGVRWVLPDRAKYWT